MTEPTPHASDHAPGWIAEARRAAPPAAAAAFAAIFALPLFGGGWFVVAGLAATAAGVAVAVVSARRATRRRALRAKAATETDILEPPRLTVDDLRLAFEAAPDPAALLDARARLVAVNAAARRMLGAPPIGADVSALMRQPALLDAVARTLADGAPREVEIVRHGRNRQHYRARIRSMAPPQQEALAQEHTIGPSQSGRARLLVALHDETRARVAEQLHRDFVANASHELRTPLASLTGFIETLLGPARDDPSARERFLGIMAQQADRMRRLVDDLLSLNRIELSEHVPPEDAVDLASAAADAAAAVALDGADRTGASRRVALELPPDLPPVRGDRAQLTRAIENLIANALKYGDSARPPRIVAASPPVKDGFVGLTVEDFGPGLSKEHLPRLTERFYRVEEGPGRRAPGTGLGLAIVKHVMARHRGGLDIESEVGRGSRFTIWTPIAGRPIDGASRRRASAADASAANATRSPQPIDRL